MSRRVTRSETEELLGRLRSRIKGLTLRTTFITGFPGETDDDFAQLVEFVAAAHVRADGRFHVFARARYAGRESAGSCAGRRDGSAAASG